MSFRSVINRPFCAVRRSTPMALACCVMPVLLTGCDRPTDLERKIERIERYSELDEAADTWRFDYAMALGQMSTDDFLQWTFERGAVRSADYALLILVGRHEPREVVRQTILEVAEEFPEQWLDQYLSFAMSFDPTLFPEIAAMHPGFDLCTMNFVGMPMLIIALRSDDNSEMLDLLLERGCDPNVLAYGMSALAFAVRDFSESTWSIEPARKLVRHGADLDLAGDLGVSARKILQREGMYEVLAILEREAAAAAARKGAGQ